MKYLTAPAPLKVYGNSKITKVCIYCKKEFVVPYKDRDRKYCSHPCYGKGKYRGTFTFTCLNCGKTFERLKWMAEQKGVANKFCSGSCCSTYQTIPGTTGQKRNAHAEIERGLKNGNIKRKPCQVCGNPETDAHHDDYSKPLDVVWLCTKHHRELHSKGGHFGNIAR